MCGFFYSLGLDISRIDEEVIDYLLYPRGPDAKGLLKFDNEYLHHRRLSIIDPDKRSNQPMVIGEITIVIKGINKKRNLEFEESNLKKELTELVNAGLSLSAASKYLAKKNGLKKSVIYNLN